MGPRRTNTSHNAFAIFNLEAVSGSEGFEASASLDDLAVDLPAKSLKDDATISTLDFFPDLDNDDDGVNLCGEGREEDTDSTTSLLLLRPQCSA
eukprot:4974145-Karenia_brevis.AAC.1